METRMVVLAMLDHGVVRSGMHERAQRLWDGYANNNKEQIAGATRLHINRDFQDERPSPSEHA